MLTILGIAFVLGGIGTGMYFAIRDEIIKKFVIMGLAMIPLGICITVADQVDRHHDKCVTKAEEARTDYRYDTSNGCRLKTRDGRFVHDSKWRVTD